MARQFEFCLHTLKHCADRRPNGKGRRPLGNVTNDANHKLGRKKGAEKKEKHDAKMRMVVLGVLRYEKLRSMHSHLGDNKLSSLRTSLRHVLDSKPQLKHIFVAQNRADPVLRVEAEAIIRRRFGGEEDEESEPILDLPGLKKIADGLDFEATPRTTRDGESKHEAFAYLPWPSRRLIVVCLYLFQVHLLLSFTSASGLARMKRISYSFSPIASWRKLQTKMRGRCRQRHR